MKLLKHILLTLSLALLVPAASAGTFSVNAWTNDASSGIVAGQTVWAYHFGVTNIATVNGVTVPGVGTNGNPSVAGQFSVSGIPFVFLNDNNLLTALGGSGSAVMAKNFLYGGTPGLITVQGLTTGQVYTVSIYGVSFDPPAARASNFTNGTDTIYVNENASPTRIGVRVDYTFTATATTNLTIVMPTNANTFHTYGLALRQPLRVTTNSDDGPGSLRQAVLDEVTLSGTNTITFAPALSGATILLNSPLTLNQSLTIDGSALPGGITINGNGTSGVFVINSGATVVLTALNITNGNSGYGGGVLNDHSTVTLNQCTLSGNGADNSGGGGGGIGNNFGTTTLNQCTLYGNHANDSIGFGGGGILNYNGTLNVNQCTIYGNSSSFQNGSPFGGGISVFGPTVIGNSIVAGNIGDDFFGLSYTSTGVNFIGGNPMLAPLGNYGGPTQTMPPLPGSPAIDAASVISGLTTDQRGSARKSGAAPDIGAVESGGLWVQNSNNSGANSLRDVIANSASITNSKTILFTTNLSGTTITLASEIVLSNNVAIDANSLPGGITVSGGNVTRIFHMNSDQTVSLRGLTLTRGNGVGSIEPAYGGAILSSGNLSMTQCTLFENSTSSGGAIENRGTLNLTQCTLSGNSAQFGGAIVSSAGGTLNLTHCTLALNNATSGSFGGGAVDNYNFGMVNLTACILAGNTAASGTGPELWMESGTLNATNCLVGNGTDSTITNGVNGNLVGTGASPINALLAPLGNYGGPTKTMPPLPGSPAINAAGATSFATDQRGYPRPVGLAADIGAVEGIYNAAGPGSITNITRLANGTVRLSFTNLTDASFPVVATTNLSQPSSNWTVIGYATEISAGTGLIQFTDADAAKYPQRFYRVKSP